MNNPHIQALNLAKDDHWDQAHTLIQSHTDTNACLIHAYLHRVEGDLSNADYWYHRAGASRPDNSLEQEWERLFFLVQSQEKS
jgi:hypothetical protein